MASPAPLDPELVAFLLEACGPNAPPPIVTHAACVFLSDTEAFKVKRPVSLPYLDFSTLARRRAACEAEHRLNHPGAPTLYRGVSLIVRRPDGALAFDEEGEPVEAVVRMRRFPGDALLESLAASGRLELSHMPALAAAVRASHDRAPIATAGGRELLSVLSGVEEALGAADGLAVNPAPMLARCRQTLETAAPALRRRAQAGRVRRCHGDLHLQNIVMLDGAPVLFDALEFDDALATVDVLYDLAFLLMDLARHGLTGHANRLLSAYLDEEPADAFDGFQALGAMMALRAGVRARVALDRGGGTARAEAERYLTLADGLSGSTAPVVIGIGGLSGSGKSVLAGRLAGRLAGPCGAVWLRSDVERKRLAGTGLDAPAPSSAYAPAMTERVFASLREKAESLATEGVSVVVDAVHAHAEERTALSAVAAGQGTPFVGLWLDCPEAERVRRVEARRGDVSDAGAEIARRQSGYALGEMDWMRLDASAGADAVLAQAVAALRPYIAR